VNDDIYDPPESDEPYDPDDPYHAEPSTQAGESSSPRSGGNADGVLEDLATQMEELQSLLRTVAHGSELRLNGLAADVAALAARVDDIEPAPEEETEEPEPKAWVDTATAQDWHELAEWTDWLIRTYDVQRSHMVLGCWPAHRGVAEELAALRTAWRSAAIKGAKPTPNDALIYWHDRWLHPALTRIRGEFQQRNCPDGHRPTSSGPPTDPELLTAAKATAQAS